MRLSLGALGWQVHTQTAFTDLLERPEGVDVISTARAGLFPAELWKWYNHMVPDRARRRNIVAADGVDAEGRSLYVTTAYRLESDPPVDRELYSRCLQSLRPVAAVRSLLLPTDPGGATASGGGGGAATPPPVSLRSLVGVHVRMLMDQALDVPGIDADTRTESNLVRARWPAVASPATAPPLSPLAALTVEGLLPRSRRALAAVPPPAHRATHDSRAVVAAAHDERGTPIPRGVPLQSFCGCDAGDAER